MFRPGQLVGGRYEIVSLIGERSLAAVFRAKDRQSGRELALKAVRPNFITRVGAQVMQREAQVAKMIGQHPSIVEAVDVGYDDALGTPFVIMPLLSGETLQQRIARAGAVPPDELQKYAAQLGHALDKAHQVGVVHAAISPSKLFLTRDQRSDLRLMVLDFGVAKVLDNHPQAAQQLSHAAYMAPEQLSVEAKRLARSYGARISDTVGGATDVWAIGLVVFEALIGAPPGAFWSVTSAHEVGLKIVQRPPIPSQVAGTNAALLPTGFDEWFKRCVHLEPTRRFARASEACDELVTLLDQLVPKPSTSLGGAVKTFVAGGVSPLDAATVAAPASSGARSANLAPMRAPMPTPSPVSGNRAALPTPAPVVVTPPPAPVAYSPAPPGAPPRILETALGIADHELSHVPPAPRAAAPSLPEAPAKRGGLVIVVAVLLVVLLLVVAVLVVVLAKK